MSCVFHRTTHGRYSLLVVQTSLESLGLVSLESIKKGDVGMGLNQQMCYAKNLSWSEIVQSSNQSIRVVDSNNCGTCCPLSAA